MTIRLMHRRRSPNSSQLDITIERGWWIFKRIETWRGSSGLGGWHKNGVSPSTNICMFLDKLAREYWSGLLIYDLPDTEYQVTPETER